MFIKFARKSEHVTIATFSATHQLREFDSFNDRLSSTVITKFPRPEMSVRHLSKRKRRQQEISMTSYSPAIENNVEGPNLFQRNQVSSVEERFLDVFYLETRDDYNANIVEDLTNKLSHLQTQDDEDTPAMRYSRLNSERSQASNEREEDAIDASTSGRRWPVKIKKQKSEELKRKSEAMQRDFDEMASKYSVSFINDKIILFPDNLGKIPDKHKGLIKRACFMTIVKEGEVRVVDGGLGNSLRLTPIDSQDLRARPVDAKMEEFIYLRSHRGYWTWRGSCEGLILPEMPPAAVDFASRPGYRWHLEHERLEDEDFPANNQPPDEHTRRRATTLLGLVDAWIKDDPDGKLYSSLQDYTSVNHVNDQVMSDADRRTPASTPGRSNASELGEERMQSPTLDKVTQPPAPATPNPGATPAPVVPNLGAPAPVMPNLGAPLAPVAPNPDVIPMEVHPLPDLDRVAVADLIERRFKDETHNEEAWTWKTELLKLEPNLHVCIRCNASTHETSKCPQAIPKREQGGGRGVQLYYVPAQDSVAARQDKGYRCPYPYCHMDEYHRINSCPALHRRCPKCRCRGHGNGTYQAEGNRIYADCPQIAINLNDVTPGSAVSPSYSTLIDHFEKHADSGHMTRWRHHVAACGFYPCWGEGDVSMVSAIGYRFLNSLEIITALELIRQVNQLCATAFISEGRPSLQWTVVPDKFWPEIWEGRAKIDKAKKEAKRKEKKEQEGEDAPKAPKSLRRHSPPRYISPSRPGRQSHGPSHRPDTRYMGRENSSYHSRSRSPPPNRRYPNHQYPPENRHRDGDRRLEQNPSGPGHHYAENRYRDGDRRPEGGYPERRPEDYAGGRIPKHGDRRN